MKYRFFYTLGLFVAALAATSCSEDITADYNPTGPGSASAVMTLTMAPGNNGTLNLSINAPEALRPGVWIDLNNDGMRAADKSEDVKTFNAYTEYTPEAGVNRVSVYGNVTYLGCTDNALSALDVSKNTALTTLNCAQNQLASVDVSKNTALERLDCSENNISALDVSNNSALLSLWCYNNKLSTLDVTSNTALAALDCSGNALTKIDLSANTALERLLCQNNVLTALDLSANTALNRLWMYGNPMSDVAVTKMSAMLSTVTVGDLWMTDGTASETIQGELSAKGWVLR